MYLDYVAKFNTYLVIVKIKGQLPLAPPLFFPFPFERLWQEDVNGWKVDGNLNIFRFKEK